MKQERYYLEVKAHWFDETQTDTLSFKTFEEAKAYRDAATRLAGYFSPWDISNMEREKGQKLLASLGFTAEEIESNLSTDLIAGKFGFMLFDDGNRIAREQSYTCYYGRKVSLI